MEKRESLPKEFTDLCYKAYEYAHEKHQGQKRKYTGEDYITHPLAISLSAAGWLSRGGKDWEVIAAAMLHDVVEDTDATLEEIDIRFGPRVRDFVEALTSVYTKEAYPELNRAERKKREADRLATISPTSASIKYLDIRHNVTGLAEQDRDFARTYLKEKWHVMMKMRQGEPYLWYRTVQAIEEEMVKCGISLFTLEMERLSGEKETSKEASTTAS